MTAPCKGIANTQAAQRAAWGFATDKKPRAADPAPLSGRRDRAAGAGCDSLAAA